MRAMAEQHAVGGGERQRVAGAFFPGQVLRPRHELLRLHAGELREGAVRRLIAPDALRGREHRVAAIAFLVVAIVLVAVDDDFVADLPARHLGADCPDDAGRVGACDVIGAFMRAENGNGLAERGPDAVVVHARGHHEDEHFVAVDLPGGHDFHLHGALGRTVPVGPDRPGIHVLRNMAERRHFADLVQVLLFRTAGSGTGFHGCHFAHLFRMPRACFQLPPGARARFGVIVTFS